MFIVDNCCIFCLKHHDNIPEPDKQTCHYGLSHEFPVQAKAKPAPRLDKQLCTKCGLHVRNPASATSDCVHAYPA